MYLYRPGRDSRTDKSEISDAASKEYTRSSTNTSSPLHGQAEPGWDTKTDGEKGEAEGAKTGCAPRHAGKWRRVHGLAVLAASRRESRREAFPFFPPHLSPSSVASSLSILPYFVKLLSRRSQLCLCRRHDYHRVGKGGAYTKVSDLVRFFFFFSCDDVYAEHGVTQGSRYEQHGTCAPFAKGPRRYVRDVAPRRQNDYSSLPHFFLQFTPLCTCPFNWERNAFHLNRTVE